MTNEERKEIVGKLLKDGRSLSEILDHLHREKGDSITYMELRLLLSEMPDAKLPEKELPKAPALPPEPKAADAAGKATAGTATGDGGAKLHISVDQLPRPGSMLSGYARFSSGAKAQWFLDEFGRLGMEPELGSSKPTQKDMQEFTGQLKQMLSQG